MAPPPATDLPGRQPFAVVLLDIKLPDMDGVRLKHLRQDFPETSVLRLSYPPLPGRWRHINWGLDCTVKPFRIGLNGGARPGLSQKNRRPPLN